MRRRIIELEDRALTPEEAKRWLRLIYMHYFPVDILGGANQRRLFRKIKILFEQPKKAKLTMHFISKHIQIESIPWIDASLDQETKTRFVAKLITILMNTLLIEVRNTFYLTENNKNKNLFWHKFEWKDSTMEHIRCREKGGGLVPASKSSQNPAGVRFIPSGNKFRMVMPLSAQILNTTMKNGSQLDKVFHYKGIELTMGKVIVNLLKHLTDSKNNDLVVNTETVKSLNNRIKKFLFENHDRELHGIQCDIEKCYDSLPIKSVLKLCKRQIEQFASKQSHIQYDFEVKVNEENFPRNSPFRWSFKPNNGWENKRLPSFPVTSILTWLDQVQMLPIRHYDDVYNYRFMPHSLLVSKVAVCLYLQSKSIKMTASDEFQSAPFLACRMVDDIIILSADPKLCYKFYQKMAEFVTLNDDKTKCSMHIDPMLNKNEVTNFNIAGISLGMDLKTVWLNPRINRNPIIFRDPKGDISGAIQRSLSGLMIFFCGGNIAPVGIVSNPLVFKNEYLSYAESIFTTLINRFYCIIGHCNNEQRAKVHEDFLTKLVQFAMIRIKTSLLHSIKKCPIAQPLKKILRERAWALTAMARTNAIRQISKKYKKCPKMDILKKKYKLKRHPKPIFDEKWNMEIWAKVSRRFKPVADKKDIIKNLTDEF